MTKDELLAAIKHDRARLDGLVASLDDARIMEPTLEDGWSVKDVLAHISAWERLCAGWLESVARGVTPERPDVGDVDATNARFYEAAKNIALVDVLAESRASHDAIVRVISLLSEADLADEKRFGWPVWQMASGNTDEHYREHIDQIEAWPRGRAS